MQELPYIPRGAYRSKCQKFDSQAQEEVDQALLENQASNIFLANETVVSEERARLITQKLDVHSVNNCHETSTGDKGIDAGQHLILQEIQKWLSILERWKNRQPKTGNS